MLCKNDRKFGTSYLYRIYWIHALSKKICVYFSHAFHAFLLMWFAHVNCMQYGIFTFIQCMCSCNTHGLHCKSTRSIEVFFFITCNNEFFIISLSGVCCSTIDKQTVFSILTHPGLTIRQLLDPWLEMWDPFYKVSYLSQTGRLNFAVFLMFLAHQMTS